MWQEMNMLISIFQNLFLHCYKEPKNCTMQEGITSDLSITNGCKSVLCHPAVNGASMLCPLNLTYKIYFSINGTNHFCRSDNLAHSKLSEFCIRKFYTPIFFCCLNWRFRTVISGRWLWKTVSPLKASSTSNVFHQPANLSDSTRSDERKISVGQIYNNR